MLKVINRCVNILDEEFVLISDVTKDGKQFFGTIPYTELDNEGKMKRGLNGFEMSIDFDSIGKAIERREHDIKRDKLIQKYMSEGLNREDACTKTIKELYKIGE